MPKATVLFGEDIGLVGCGDDNVIGGLAAEWGRVQMPASVLMALLQVKISSP